MNTIPMRAALAAAAVAGALLAVPAVASASPSDPTVGDTVSYTFYSDVPGVSLTWFDADGDIAQKQVALTSRNDDGRYVGTVSFVSRSTYQPVVATLQTDGYFAACTAAVNGTPIGSGSAQGHFAVASCPN